MIRKNSGGTILDSSRVFILGIDSKIIAEYIYVSGAWKVDHYNLYANDIVGKFVPTTGNSGNRYYYEKDHLGSVRVVVKDSATSPIVSWTDFYPYGKISREGSSLDEPKDGFTGYIHDDESNLEYAGARYYNSILGRYLTCDPQNEYPSPFIYVGNNPINLIDPKGLASDSPSVKQEEPKSKKQEALLKFDEENNAKNDAENQGINAPGSGGIEPLFPNDVLETAILFTASMGTLAEIKAAGGFLAWMRALFVSGTDDLIRAGVKYASTPTKLAHIFGDPGHKLASLVKSAGNEQKALQAVIKELTKVAPKAGQFENITVKVLGNDVTVKGFVDNGIIKIGTMYIR